MNTGQKISFGNKNTATSYTVNPNTFGLISGDNVQATSVPYQPQSTNIYGATTSTLPTYSENVVYGQQTTPVYTSPVNVSPTRVDANLNYGQGYNYSPSQQIAGKTTKITFGGKPHSQIYTPIQQTTYVQPLPTYETYRQPTEIQTILSQPIREETRYEQRVQPVRNEFKEEFTSSVPAPIVERRKKTKKGGCPSWIWILLGILVLAGLIVGLVYLFGGFGGAAGAVAGAKPIVNGTADEGAQVNVTTTETNTNATKVTTQPTTAVTTQPVTQPTPSETTFTVQPTTTQTTTTGTTFVTPTQTIVPTSITPGYVAPSSTTVEDISIEPSFFAPNPVISSSSSTYTTDYSTVPAASTSYDITPSTYQTTPSTYQSAPFTYQTAPSAEYYAVSSQDQFATPSIDQISPQVTAPVAF